MSSPRIIETFTVCSGVDFRSRSTKHLQDEESPATDSSDSTDQVEIGTEAHNYKSSAPRPMGSPLDREITVELLRYRRACQGYSAPRKGSSSETFCGDKIYVRSPLSAGSARRPATHGTRVQSAPNLFSPDKTKDSIANNISFVKADGNYVLTIGLNHQSNKEIESQSGGADDLSRPRLISMRAAIASWLDFHAANMGLKQRIIEQYLGCCAYLKRPPILRNQLRCFLLKPSTEHLDLSSSGISSKDIAAIFCAMAGRGCGLKEDRVINFQQICCELGDSGLLSIDLSCNTLGSEGIDIFVNILIHNAEFFHISRPIDDPRGSGISRSLQELDISSNAIGTDGSKSISILLSASNCTLQTLRAGGNLLGDQGCTIVVNALLLNTSLKMLSLSENGASNSAGTAVGAMLERNSCIQELDLNYNHLRGLGAKGLSKGLAKNKTLKVLKLQWNGFGDVDTMGELARALPHCAVSSLNLAHNRIKLQGASILASTLEAGSELRELNLDDNMIGQIGVRNIFRAIQSVGQSQEFPTTVSTVNCGAHIVDKSAFDPCETAGGYQLDLKDSYNRSVLAKLIRLNRSGNGSFVNLRANGKATAYNATLGGANVKISDNGSIDMMDWFITTAHGHELPINPENDDEGQPIPLQATWARILGRREDAVSCLLSFSFSNNRKRPNADDRLSQKNFELLHSTFTNPSMSVDQCVDLINVIFGSDVFISIEQVEQLLSVLSDQDDAVRDLELGKVRICFMSRCFHKLVESGRSSELIDKLTSIDERKALEKALGTAGFEFTRNNPTGFHKLDLGDSLQREICLRLVELRNEALDRVIQFWEFYSAPGRGGGRRDTPDEAPDMERVWRNSKLNGAPFRATPDWRVPYSGTLEVDFVQILKPDCSMDVLEAADNSANSEYRKLLYSLQKDGPDEREKISILRRYSNSEYFSCRQLAAILNTFTQPELRVEACVIGFARTVDWHGYKNVTLKLDSKEIKMLHSRIGFVNLFDDIVAVDYYELDLSRSADRFAMQELLHLASVEPGHNMVDCIFQDIDFVVPSGWLKDVPRAGLISLYYCREQRVIERVFDKGSWDDSGSPFHTREDGTEFGPSAWSTYTPRWLQRYCERRPQAGPVPCSQPHGIEWVRPYKIRRIKRKMMDKFQDPRKMFAALDRDGGGTLDRKELAMGLFALGVWLAPTELQALLEILDQDGGGEIEYDEFKAFWDTYTFD